MPSPVTAPLIGAGDTVSSKVWGAKVAVTDWFAVMLTVHAPLPEHAPPHALSVPPLAVSVTDALAGKLVPHVPAEQLMPAGLLVTVPVPLTVTDSVYVEPPPFATVTWKPVAVCPTTATLIPLAESRKVSPGSHMAPASFGSPFPSGSTTWASRSLRVVSTLCITTASPGSVVS